MKQYPCIESTAELQYKNTLIRLWRDEETLEAAEAATHQDVASELSQATSLADAAQRIAALPRVNAVHVMDVMTRRGLVAYVNWP